MNKLRGFFAILLIAVLIFGVLPTSVLASASASEDNSSSVVSSDITEIDDDCISVPLELSESQDETTPPEVAPPDAGEPAPEAEETDPPQADDLDAGEPSPVPEATGLPEAPFSDIDSTPPDEPLATPEVPEVTIEAVPTPNDEIASPIPEETLPLQPVETTQPEVSASPSPVPEMDVPGVEEPSIDEPYGDGIVMGPNNPPEGAPMVISANGNSVTIAIRSCYDSAGNSIKYTSAFQYDGRWVGGATYPRHIIYADNEPAYCLEPGAYLPGGTTVSKDAAKVWSGLSAAKQNAIKLAILCGAEGNSSNLSGNYGSQYTATQMIIWEFIVGVRSTSSPYSVSDNKVINSVCYDGANSEVKTVYDQIAAAMVAYDTLPSFANPLDDSPPQTALQFSNGTYSLTLTDSNKVLSNFNVSCTDKHVTLSVSGNKLTMTSSVYVSGATVNVTRKSTASADSQIVAYGGEGLQETVIGIEAVSGTPGCFGIYSAYIPHGNAKIVKTSSDGKVSGITFTIKGGSVSKSVTTGSDGTFTVENLSPGTYTVTETVPDGYTADKASQTVTVKDGETASVKFKNTLKTGNLKIVKTSEDGKVSGITFTVTGNNVSQTVTTGSDGSITVPGLKPGTYTVTETVPDGYSSSAASQTVTVKYDQTATVNFYNSLKTGNLKIIKKSNDGKVSGIQFTITGNWVNKTVISGTDGTIVENGLKPGTYNVTEKVPDGYVCDNATQSVTVKYDQTVSVTFNNKLKTGDVKIVKTSDDGKVSGITFTVKGGSVNQTVKSGTDGTITVPGLIPGKYTVTEQVSENYVCDNPSQTVTVEYDKTTTVNFANKLKQWRITVVKEDAEGDVARYSDATLAGAVYGIYKDGQLQKTYTTDEHHSFTTDYYVCGSGWTLREITASPGYTVDPTVYEIGAEPGDFTIAANSLDLSVPEHIIKGTLVILKQDEEGQHPLEGATFHVFDELGAKVAEATTGPDGKATFPELQYGAYTYREIVPPKYFELDENVYDFSMLEDGETITLTRDDTRIPGSISVKKVDTKGNNLSGAVYLLEWSQDGRSWTPVTSRTDTPVIAGGCTSPGLSNGQLTTGSDGLVTFSGLRADGVIQYRLTEIKAPPGLALLKDPIFTGTLPLENRDELTYDISYTITDNRITELPHTGASGFDPVTIGTVLTGLAGCAGIFITKKYKRRNAK